MWQHGRTVLRGFPLPRVSPMLIASRGLKKKWEADEIQLFVSDYQHANPLDHAAYQFRRYKYAKKGLVAPRAHDQDTEEEDLTDEMIKYIPKAFKAFEFDKHLEEDIAEAYTEFRREQKIAKDDVRSPYYFSDDEEAKEYAMKSALTSALARADTRDRDRAGVSPTERGKHKLMSDNGPPEYTPGSSVLSSYVPEPEPVNYPQWDPYSIEFPLRPIQAEVSQNQGLPIGLPKWREMDRQEDGSANARGSRKNATAWATVRRGTGAITVNGQALVEYFPPIDARDDVLAPLLVSESLLDFDVQVKVYGGGVKGQAGACRHAIANALQKYDPSYRLVLKAAGLLKRDPRMVERKKPGKPGARKSFQWVKR